MSEERALLKEFIDFVDSYEFYPTERNIIWEIVSRTQELLAQPEQTEQDAKDKFQDLATYGVSFSKGGQRIDPRDVYISTEPEQEPVGYLYKQMDCTGEWATIFKVDKPYITWHDIKDIVPLYTAPPKRETLSDGEITDLWANKSPANEFECVRLVEKAHGIGGGE